MPSSPSRRRGRVRLVDQRLAPRLVGLEDREQAGDARPQRAVVRQPLQRLAEQRHALLVDGAVRPHLGEAERGAGERVGVAVAAGGGRGLRVAPAGGLDVARGEGRVREVEQRRAALGRGRLGAERERLERLRVVRGGLGVPERGTPPRAPPPAPPPTRAAGRRPRARRPGRGGRSARRDVGARVAAHDQGATRPPRGSPRAALRAAPRAPRRGRCRARTRSAPAAAATTSPAAVPRSSAAGGDGAGDAGGADEVGDREAPGDGADLEHRAGVVAEPLDAPAHHLAHAGGDERRRRRAVRPSAAISRTSSAT